jgi:anti-sigma regulatory factor (Ser/Thr protein kinase)
MEAFAIAESSQTSQARRSIAVLAGRLGFDEEDAGRVALVVTELCSNLIKHGGGGDLLANAVPRGDGMALDLVAVDKGVGMLDVGKCLRDGFSTGGTPGTGLGAIQRLSQAFDLYSLPDKGTVVAARLWPRAPVRDLPVRPLDVAAILKPKSGETACGDGWALLERLDGFTLLGIDGLGHGLTAAQVASVARETFRQVSRESPGHIMQALHTALRSTRGAAVTVIDAALDRGQANIAAIGNLATAIVTHGVLKRLPSDNGIVGHTTFRMRELTYPVSTTSAVILHSDGLSASWSLDRYPGLMQRQSAVIAGVLYRDQTRERDDSMIVVIKRGEL